MISFRYHVVSLLAVLLALAVGIALGSGPLQRPDSDSASGTGDPRQLASAKRRTGQADESLSFADDYARATASRVLGGTLHHRAITVVSLPGADPAAVTGLSDMVKVAGGKVTARVVLGEALLDVGRRQLVTELASQLQDSVKSKVKVPGGATGYERLGLLLAHAVATKDTSGAEVDGAGDSVLAGLATAHLVTTRGSVDKRGSLVVVVAGAPYGSADTRAGAGEILATVLRALDGHSDGVVLTGPVSAGADDGLVGLLRADPDATDDISTVDVADRTAGAALAVLAAKEQAKGRAGQYGTASAEDGPMPGAGGH